MQTYTKTFLLALFLSTSVFAGSELTFSILTLDQATQKVIEELKTKVLGAKTESIDGKIVHVIKVLTDDGRVQHLKIDAESGNISK
ncbi:MAG: hypothetical protein L3J59_07250 [Methylococcaceae bacterium]|nr:hypothetical protein [Methylococcaceae bacterium]